LYSTAGKCNAKQTYTTYGIGLIRFTEDNYIYISNALSDISVDKLQIANLTNLLNENNVSPIHLKDIVEDFLITEKQ